MKLVDMTKEDALKIVNAIHISTENSFIEFKGLFDLDFKESYRKYGNYYIDFLRTTVDPFDGSYYCEWKTRITVKHNSIWFEEFDGDGEASTYNKNHIFGYDKLRELGYILPDKAQWI